MIEKMATVTETIALPNLSTMAIDLPVSCQKMATVTETTIYPDLTTVPTTPPTIQTPLARPPLLALPFEIRLQIYTYIIASHPASHSHLAPAHVIQPITSSAYFLRAINNDTTQEAGLFANTQKTHTYPFPTPITAVTTPASTITLALRGSGCGRIPSSLLRTCKQIYEEARLLPFEQNAFVFINWFSSGVYAARGFMRGLREWQRHALRYARIEVLRRDLENSWVPSMAGGRLGSGEWNDLCGLWSGDRETGEGGLWGLRLGIKGRIGGSAEGIAIDGTDGNVQVMEMGTGGDYVAISKLYDTGLLNVDAEWVADGLCHMKALRWLEIEIEDEDIPKEKKVEFCVELGKNLTEKQDRKVEVLFVEQLPEKPKQEEVVPEPATSRVRMFIAGLYS